MTIKDIAKEAGVSITTVSKIVNGHDQNISDATKSRVRKVIAERNYVANPLARGLKTNKTQMLGLILPDIANPYFPEIARGIQDVARSADFAVIYCNTDNKPEQELECLEFLKAQRVDGIIYACMLKGPKVKNIADVNIPMVVVDRTAVLQLKADVGKVYVDVAQAMYEATGRMAQAGCRNIAYISADCRDRYDRYYGYVDALKELDIPLRKELVYFGEYSPETGYKGMLELLSRQESVDGVVCGNDLIAIGVLDALRSRDIKVPEEIKVIGLDNIYMADFTNPRLSTMAQPALEMGKVAATMLIDHLSFGTPLFQQVLSHHYVQRESL